MRTRVRILGQSSDDRMINDEDKAFLFFFCNPNDEQRINKLLLKRKTTFNCMESFPLLPKSRLNDFTSIIGEN